MTDVNLASEIATQVIERTSIWVAIIGFAGVVSGALIAIAGNILIHWLKERKQANLDKKRKDILKEMLSDTRFSERWRNLETLSAVIGTDNTETKRLLIGIGARGSEISPEKWGLLKNHPLPSKE